MGNEDLKAMLEDIKQAIEDDEYEPSAWEQSFLANIGRLIADDKELSDAQDESLSKIWRRAKGY